MTARVSEIRRTGIDVLKYGPQANGVFFLDIYGDPSDLTTGGFDVGIGSIARRWDGTYAGAMYTKIGALATDWVAIYFGLSRALSVTDLPDLSAVINAEMIDAVSNPFTAAPGLTTPDDMRFALKTGFNSL